MKNTTDNSILLLSNVPSQSRPNPVQALCTGLAAGGIMGAVCTVSGTGQWISVLCGVFGAASALLGRKRLWLIPAVFLYAVILYVPVLDGLRTYYNCILQWLTVRTGRIFLPLNGNGTDAAFFLAPLGILLSLILARRWTLLPLGLLLCLGCILSLFPGGWYLLPLTLGVLGAFWNRPGAAHVLTMALCLLIALPLALTVGQEEGTVDLQSAVHGLRYDSKTNSMPEGCLANLPAWEKSDTPALAVTMVQPQKLYLRGFVGEVYDGTAWKKAPVDPQNADLFYWLHRSGFYAPSALAVAAEKVGLGETVSLTVENLSACKAQAYLPTALAGNDALDSYSIGDTVAPGMEGALTLQMVPGSVPQWYGIQAALAENQEQCADYLALEQAYRRYVLDRDLQLTPEAAAAAEAMLGSSMEGTPRGDIRFEILDCLGRTLTYDETVCTWSGTEDFLSYVRQVSPKGYSVHYATAAVIMLRYCGVPARYAEGYYLSRETAEACVPGEVFILTEKNAHAWAEYYLDGVGWIPLEVTPGYIDLEDLAGAEQNGGMQYEDSRPPQLPLEQPNLPMDRENDGFRLLLHWWYLLILLALALGAGLAEVLHRRLRLRRTLASIARADDREAAAMLYGYAQLLLRHAPEVCPEGAKVAARLNREVQFSPHPVTQEQRQWMEGYCQGVLLACRRTWSFRQRLYYRFIRCILL